MRAQQAEARKRLQEEEAKRFQEEEAARKQAQEEEARKQAQEEEARKQAQEEEARKQAQEEEARRQQVKDEGTRPGKLFRALYSYSAMREDELSVVDGDIVKVCSPSCYILYIHTYSRYMWLIHSSLRACLSVCRSESKCKSACVHTYTRACFMQSRNRSPNQ